MLYVGHRDGYGLKPNRDIGLFEQLMSSNSLWLTGNTDTVYASAFLDTRDGPVVVEVPRVPGLEPSMTPFFVLSLTWVALDQTKARAVSI